MTREEAIKILAVLKAAYPNSYKGMTKDEANGTISVWSTQFVNIPYIVVSIAVNKIISTNTFPPSISEVKAKIQTLYTEANSMLENHKTATEGIPMKAYAGDDENGNPLYEIETVYMGKKLDDNTLALVQEIIKACEPMRTKLLIEPSLEDLLKGFNTYLTDGSSEQKQLRG